VSERTITLPRVAFNKLRENRATVALADSEGQRVFLFTKQVWPSDRHPGPQPSVILSPTDLDLINQPEGLVVADVTHTTGWTIRVEREAAR
jgi:hypothetical protein